MAARATWTGAVTCGLVSVPCKLYTARDDNRIKFHQINKSTGNRVRQRRVDEKTGDEVAYDDIVKGFDLGNDRYIVLDDADLEKVEPRKNREIQILQFCKITEIPTLAFDKPYYVGPNTGGARAYKLLTDRMRDAGVVAIGRMVMRSCEYLVCLSVLDGGVLACETLAFADEIRPTDWICEEADVSEAEEEMAERLIDAMVRPLDFSSLRDEHRLKVLAMIEARAGGLEPVEEVDEPAPAADLLQALESSLQAMQEEVTPVEKKSKVAAKA